MTHFDQGMGQLMGKQQQQKTITQKKHSEVHSFSITGIDDKQTTITESYTQHPPFLFPGQHQVLSMT